MPKKTTLKEIADMLAHVVKHMATKEDLAEVRREMASKEQLGGLHAQVNSIESQLRGMKFGKLETRVANLEEKVFGRARS